MRMKSLNGTILGIVLLGVSFGSACSRTNAGSPTAQESSTSGKIPVTTKSEEARQEFLKGRDLSEKLLVQDSLQHFDKAIELDPDFAYAELARATSSNTAKDFFQHLQKAVSLADKASDGEKLLILATDAGANGDTAKQKDSLEKLVSAYPNDERAQFSLGNFYFGQQDLNDAIEHYKKATELAPNYSQAYNLLGYAYRQQGDYANAEQVFKKYIDLIPNDPNPYDSYAEMLLKRGEFQQSVEQYRKALSVDPTFSASHLGIAADLTYMGKPEEAISELQQVHDKARSDGERRAALFAMSVVEADRGKLQNAADYIDKEYAVAEKNNDTASMAADLQAKGNILVEMQKYGDAQHTFDQSLKFIEDSNLSQDIKNNAKLNHHFNLAAIALGKKELTTARSEADEFRKGAEASKNAAQLKQAHELQGRIALATRKYDEAIAELEQANLQNPQNLFRLSEAYRAKGDTAKAQDYCIKAAWFNSLPQLNYAFIRMKAQKMSGGKQAVASTNAGERKL